MGVVKYIKEIVLYEINNRELLNLQAKELDK